MHTASSRLANRTMALVWCVLGSMLYVLVGGTTKGNKANVIPQPNIYKAVEVSDLERKALKTHGIFQNLKSFDTKCYSVA